MVPEGCAHGFQVLEKNTELLYFHTGFYSREHEDGIRFDDPAIKIVWPKKSKNVSKRDISFKLIGDNFLGCKIR